MNNVYKYHKCSFCTNKHSPRFQFFNICMPKHIDYDDYDDYDDGLKSYEFQCSNYNHFNLDGDKVIKTAKELDISITELLALINASST